MYKEQVQVIYYTGFMSPNVVQAILYRTTRASSNVLITYEDKVAQGKNQTQINDLRVPRDGLVTISAQGKDEKSIVISLRKLLGARKKPDTM